MSQVLKKDFDDAAIYDELATALKREIEDYSIVNMTMRPFSSVYRLKLIFSDGNTMAVYLKVYHKSNKSLYNTIQIENEFLTTKFWYDYFKKSEKHGVIKPLYYNSKKRIIVTEESKGVNLGYFIFKKARFFPSEETRRRMFKMVFNAGEWLHLFQSAKPENNIPPISLSQIVEYINLRMDKIVENDKINFTIHDQKLINEYIAQMWAGVPDKDKKICYLHSDFSLSNILVQDEKIVVLDFGRMKSGSPFQDLSRFYHQIMLLKNKPIYKKSVINKLAENYLAGYGDTTIYTHPLFKIYLMTHVINHLGKTARYWEHGFFENLYNRWIVRNTIKEIKDVTG